MRPTVDTWSSPTTVYAGGLRQLTAALGGREMVLFADARLDAHIGAVTSWNSPLAVVPIALTDPVDDIRDQVTDALLAHPEAVPVALGGGSIMDVVRLAALAAADPNADGFRAAPDGVTFLPTRAVNPTVCIPSTVGTASEVSAAAVRHSTAGVAMVVSPGLRSSAAILDSDVTRTLPVTALASGLVEPWARVCVPAVAGDRARVQDGVARGLAATILGLGDELAGDDPDDSWRSAAALASAQTHLSLLAVGRAPAGHVLWPLATEVSRATGLPKAVSLAALVPAWLRCLDSGAIGLGWGSASRVLDIIGVEAGEAAARLESWLAVLSLPTLLPASINVDVVVERVIHPWQSSGLFLPEVAPQEIGTVIGCARASGSASS